MAVRSLRGIKPIIWIPPTTQAIFKLTVERSDGKIDDITEIISGFEVEDSVTDSIGTFKFQLWNVNETFTEKWTGNEIFRYYSDYAATATTLRFRGRVEKVSYVSNKIRVTGRSEGVKLMDVTVTQNYTGVPCDVILKDMISKYSSFTDTNVLASGTVLTVNWYQKPFWDCVQEISNASGFDCYLDASLDFHFFQSGTVQNNEEGIVHTYNLLEVGDFAEDLAQIKNRVILYGAEQEGTQLIYTAESNDSNYGVSSDLGVREEIVNDSNITDYTQAKELADATLDKRKNPPIIGEVTGIILATVQPGENIRLSSPADNLPPDWYQTVKYKHTVNYETGKFETEVSVNKEPRKVYHIMKTIIENQNKGKKTDVNPYEMRFSNNFLFASDIGTHTNTEITNGVLKLQTGEVAGVWISPLQTLDNDIISAYLVMNGETLTGATVEVSGDGQVNWQEITNRNKIDITTARGTNLYVRVTFDDADTQITSLSLLYKTG